MTFMTNQSQLGAKSALFSRDIRKRAARQLEAKRDREPAIFVDQPPGKLPDPKRGEPSRMVLRECDEAIKTARLSLDAAKKAFATKREERRAKMRAVDAAKGITTHVVDDYDSAGREAVKNEAKRYLEDVEAAHDQWVLDGEVGPAPLSLAQAQAKIDKAVADKAQARKMVDLFEGEVEQRERALNAAKRRRAEAQAEVLSPVLEQLRASHEAHIMEAVRIRQIIDVVGPLVPLSGLRLSGPSEIKLPDESTDARNAIAALAIDADASLDCILKPFKTPLRNGHAT